MYNDVIYLKKFYNSRVGIISQRLIGAKLRRLWPSTTGMTVLGMGYATPYLAPFRNGSELALAAMSAPQGVTHWPKKSPGLVALSAYHELPFPDRSIDRLLVVHGLEDTENLPAILRELWRVVKDEGRIIAVVPNRRGLWAKFEKRSPFGHSRPFNSRQIWQLLQDGLFVPLRVENALYFPPTRLEPVIRRACAIEKIGHCLFRALAGVLIIEASKQIYTGSTDKKQAVGTGQRFVKVHNSNAASRG